MKLLKRIGELEMAKIGKPKFTPPDYPNFKDLVIGPGLVPQPMPSITCPVIVGGCIHEYPNPWYSVQAPTCKKCGQVAFSTVVTCEVKAP